MAIPVQLEENESVCLDGYRGPLSGPWAPLELTADRHVPSEEPNWASNPSPAMLLCSPVSTPLIQSFPCHSGTGRALIQFTPHKKKQTHSSLPVEPWQMLDMTLSRKYEDNYCGNYFILIMYSFIYFPPYKLIALASPQKPEVIAWYHFRRRMLGRFEFPPYPPWCVGYWHASTEVYPCVQWAGWTLDKSLRLTGT